MRFFSWFTAVWLVAALATACGGHSKREVMRVVPTVPTGDFSELTESALASIVVCADSMGRTDDLVRRDRCSPCVPLQVLNDATLAVRHARDVWQRFARAPYDTLLLATSCIDLTYKYARKLSPDDHDLLAEVTLFKLASVYDSVRSDALHALDTTLDSLHRTGKTRDAQRTLSVLALGMWDRAQRQLERPLDIPLDDREKHAHQLDRRAPTLVFLPAIPKASRAYGHSEAWWAARLFDRLAADAASPAERSRWHRLALSPAVTLRDWPAVDSVARALLQRAPRDSAVLPALALAAHRQVRTPVAQQPAVMALFDSALVAMARVDSARYDDFENVLTKSDDAWRNGFLPTDRLQLDVRSWAVLDPLWSTPVNEIRLEKRARMAEADYLYASATANGEAGSETGAGRVFLRRGPIDERWSSRNMAGQRWTLTRQWPGLQHTFIADASRSSWAIFHHPRFSAERLARTLVQRSLFECADTLGAHRTILGCAESRQSDWNGVPFYGRTDTIDVVAARFRVLQASAYGTTRAAASRTVPDSVDIYLGAHVPLRTMKFDGRNDATSRDRITLSAWFATPLGQIIHRLPAERKLPSYTERAWQTQWSARLQSGTVMHRVEAMEPTQPAGARGAAILTSDALADFPLRGFGMSDILVAGKAMPGTRKASRWRDLRVTPNGGVIAPRQQFALAWEVYDLAPAKDGRVRWRIEIRREQGVAVQRGGIRDVITSGKRAGERVIAVEPDAPAVAYNRDDVAAPAVMDHLTFNLGEAPPGRHVVQVTVKDLVSGRSVSRGVLVRVLAKDAQARRAR